MRISDWSSDVCSSDLISSSIVTNGMCARLQKAGEQFPDECLLDADGRPSRDPNVFATDPPGTIMPLGGTTAGHKGLGMALMVEALTGGLAGHGRTAPSEGWGAPVFLRLHGPHLGSASCAARVWTSL